MRIRRILLLVVAAALLGAVSVVPAVADDGDLVLVSRTVGFDTSVDLDWCNFRPGYYEFSHDVYLEWGTNANGIEVPWVVDTYVCRQSPPGSFAPGNEHYYSCSAGTYQPDVGQERCLNAEPGFFVPNSGAVAATPAPPGSFAGGSNAISALLCPEGYYQPDSGSATCLAAPLGSYVDVPGATAVTLAQPGFYVDVVGSATAAPCPVGYYQHESGQASCVVAPVGYYVPVVGSPSFMAAYPGTYVPVTGASSGTLCELGTFQPYYGQANCFDAPVGFYVDVVGAMGVTQCPVDTNTVTVGSDSIDDCLPPPDVQITTLTPVVNPDSRLKLTGPPYAASYLTFEWTSNHFTAEQLVDPAINAARQNSSILILKENILSAGDVLDFTLTVTDTRTGLVGLDTITIEVNEPPSGGTIEVSPPISISLETVFTLTAPGWTDPQTPLHYQFFYRHVESTDLIPLTQVSPSDTAEVHLPEGDLEIIVTVYDSLTAGGVASTFIALHYDPVTVINSIVEDVTVLNLDNGISNALDAKLANAVKALDDIKANNDISAVNKLQAFINEVQAQAGHKIPTEEAAQLIAKVEQVINLINQ